MRPPHDAPSHPTISPSAALAGIVEHFEVAWRQAPPAPDLAAFLPPEGEECRLKAGQAARVEDYLGRYPELTVDDAALSDLVAAEYRLRQRDEPGLDAGEYVARFPRQREAILARLPSTAEVPSTIRTSPPAAVPPTRMVTVK